MSRRKLSPKLIKAVQDTRYLLGRNYARESVVSFVGDKYQLSKLEKLTLYRAVYDQPQAEEHEKKLAPPRTVFGKKLAIDGYNVLITIESALIGRPIILCDDGFIRDIAMVHGKYRVTNLTDKALNLLVAYLKRLKASEVNFFFDAQVSKSGELASTVRDKLEKAKLKGNAYAVKQADTSALASGNILATSDAVLISKARAVVDLAAQTIRKKCPEKAVALTKLPKIEETRLNNTEQTNNSGP